MKRPPGGMQQGLFYQWKGLLNLALPVLSDYDPHLIDTLRQVISQVDFQKPLDRVTLLKRNFPADPSISQFINIIETEGRLPEIYDSVTKVLKTGMR